MIIMNEEKGKRRMFDSVIGNEGSRVHVYLDLIRVNVVVNARTLDHGNYQSLPHSYCHFFIGFSSRSPRSRPMRDYRRSPPSSSNNKSGYYTR